MVSKSKQMATKFPKATKVPKTTKVSIATKVPFATKDTSRKKCSNPRGLASYVIWACFLII